MYIHTYKSVEIEMSDNIIVYVFVCLYIYIYLSVSDSLFVCLSVGLCRYVGACVYMQTSETALETRFACFVNPGNAI